ncbi:MAG: hypothetical protein AAF388_10150 [Bacteroidota bacterium]
MNTFIRFLLISACLFIAILPVSGQEMEAEASAPMATPSDERCTMLFLEDEPIEIVLESDFKKLFKSRSAEPEYQIASIQYNDPLKGEVTIPLKIRLRGNFRKKQCSFPPIRFNFPKKAVKGTVFEGQDKLKLVTHCRSKKESYQQYLYGEYLAYKTYNLLTDFSFRVRMVKITYKDTSGKLDDITRYAFFIEDEGSLAYRLECRNLDRKNVHPDQTIRKQVDVLSVYQYMVGNTDWSIPSLHNIKLLKDSIPSNKPIAVPYDFDWCGIIGAPYAVPNPILGIKSVKERIYRGFCRSEEEFKESFEVFLEKKDEIYATYNDFALLDPKVRQSAIKYYDDFYEVIQNDKYIKREFMDNCRKGR